MSTRHGDNFLPEDRRVKRLRAMLADPINKRFRETFDESFIIKEDKKMFTTEDDEESEESCPILEDDGKSSTTVEDDGYHLQFSVAPHPDDLRIW